MPTQNQISYAYAGTSYVKRSLVKRIFLFIVRAARRSA